MAEIKQYETKFDRLHAEIQANHEIAERKAVRRAAQTAEIDRMMEKLWGPK